MSTNHVMDNPVKNPPCNMSEEATSSSKVLSLELMRAMNSINEGMSVLAFGKRFLYATCTAYYVALEIMDPITSSGGGAWGISCCTIISFKNHLGEHQRAV